VREIKFRGKQQDNGQWIYGDLICADKQHYFIAVIVGFRDNKCELHGVHRVDTKTVGQYTGFEDANGREIYEGDTVKINGKHNRQVFLRLGCWFVEMGKELGYYDSCDIEVIGNIYENPELLENKDEA